MIHHNHKEHKTSNGIAATLDVFPLLRFYDPPLFSFRKRKHKNSKLNNIKKSIKGDMRQVFHEKLIYLHPQSITRICLIYETRCLKHATKGSSYVLSNDSLFSLKSLLLLLLSTACACMCYHKFAWFSGFFINTWHFSQQVLCENFPPTRKLGDAKS